MFTSVAALAIVDVNKSCPDGSTRQQSRQSTQSEEQNKGSVFERISLQELATHAFENDCWIAHRGRVYDVTQFLHDHPAGYEVILEHAGTDITQVMADINIHEHSDGAYDILADYMVGFLEGSGTSIIGASEGSAGDPGIMYIDDPSSPLDAQLTEELASAKKPLLDLRKPLLWQMLTSNFSKEYYMTQVHIPRHLPEPATIFANPFLEMFTRTPWYVIPTIWGPVVGYLAHMALIQMSLFQLAYHFALGVVFWTICEYTFHRFLFHVDAWLPDHPYALTVHFLLHGIHHYLPMDRMRLVLPPALFIILVIPPFFLARLVFSLTTTCALFCGAIFGYIVYDMTHYYLHHARVRTEYARSLKRYHLAHHYKDYDAGYGITSKFWDYVFGTVLDDSPAGLRKTQ